MKGEEERKEEERRWLQFGPTIITLAKQRQSSAVYFCTPFLLYFPFPVIVPLVVSAAVFVVVLNGFCSRPGICVCVCE